ncbi:hypothetical protein GALMADRAFT_213149 [Galerina marginata CBS 339.88]|uniref:F-box domain-containing protein n=1 Tax=Galerina marginata (strain CBS 339.88) TaxID=685588 RepID=A0A067SNZ1_GALM3|nr:hypothetical protein GALMADRAFT_213149 [Galerina marginata CBS 339.88]
MSDPGQRHAPLKSALKRPPEWQFHSSNVNIQMGQSTKPFSGWNLTTNTIHPLSERLSDQVPMELYSVIIDFLYDDRSALKACSLVARAWLPCARYHLVPRNFECYIDGNNASEALAMVSHPLATIGYYIRRLFLRAPGQDPQIPSPEVSASYVKKRYYPVVNTSFVFHQILRAFDGKSHSLKVLTFYDIGSFATTNLDKAKPYIKWLTTLDLHRCAFSTFADLFSFISAGRNLQQLILVDIVVRRKEVMDTLSLSTHRVPPHLNKIGLYTVEQSQVLRWILAQHHIPVIKSASLSTSDFGELEDPQAIANFLQKTRGDLRRLKLYLPTQWRNEEILNLTHNTQLQILSVGNVPSNVLGFTKLTEIFRQVSSSKLESISIHFTGRLFPGNMLQMEWKKMAREIEAPAFFRSLKALRIQISSYDHEDAEEMKVIFHESFPILSSKEVLRIRWEESV